MKLSSLRFVFSICFSVLLIAILATTSTVNAKPPRQVIRLGQGLIPAVTPVAQEAQEQDDVFGEEKPEDDKDKEAKPAEDDVILPPRAKKTISERFVRFHMWDGSIVGGEVQQDSISIRTEFGTLQVPVSDVKKFYPGLNSFPELNSKIEKLIEGLGDKNFDVREKSHRDLAARGSQIRVEIERFDDKGSAERK